jgi:hypothetical protein
MFQFEEGGKTQKTGVLVSSFAAHTVAIALGFIPMAPSGPGGISDAARRIRRSAKAISNAALAFQLGGFALARIGYVTVPLPFHNSHPSRPRMPERYFQYWWAIRLTKSMLQCV